MASAKSICHQTTEDVGLFFWDNSKPKGDCACFNKHTDFTRSVNEIALPELAALAKTIRWIRRDEIVQ